MTRIGGADEVGDGPDTTWDWMLFDDVERLSFVRSLDEAQLAASDSLQRVVRVAAIGSGSAFAQISLIGAAQFVPAAHGLSYTSEQQHTPIRDSLCSVTMASGGTFRVDDTTRHVLTRDLPPVTDGGVHSYLGVPLRDPEGRPVGALCVFEAEPRTWNPDDESLLMDLAQIVTRELHLVAALETSANTEVLLRQAIADLVNRPRIGSSAALHARAQYAFPADAPAGGDWIDWIAFQDRVAYSIGDVAGHGLASIAVMEELRHSLRAYAIERLGPGDAIMKASEFLRQLRPTEMATAIKGDFDTTTGRTRFAVAGHPPPIHLTNGTAHLLTVRPGPPLGVLTHQPATTELVLQPGDRLLLYTDGVFERRGEPIDDGLRRLALAMERSASCADLEEASRTILDETVEGQLRDDACLLLIERPSVG